MPAISFSFSTNSSPWYLNESTFQAYLSLKSGYVLSALYLTRNSLKKLRAWETHGMNLNLVNNFQTVIIGESTVSLSAIDTIFHTLLDDIKHWWRVLLKGIELEDVVKLPDV